MSPRGRNQASLRGRSNALGLGQQVFVLYTLIVVLVIGSGVAAAVIIGDRLVQRAAEDRVLSVAQAVAGMPAVVEGLDGDDPAADLQPLAEQLRIDADVLFVVITDPDGVRHTHPNPGKIGGRIDADIVPAQRGGVSIETARGSLGESVRAVVPVVGEGDRSPRGLVAVGVTVDRKRDALADVMPLLAGAALFSLAVAACGSWWITRRLARQTFGMREAELARMYAHHHAVLHAIREGLVVVDPDGRVVLINDAAQELLEVGPEVEGGPVEDLPVTGELAHVLRSGERISDQVLLARERLVVVSQVPVDDLAGAAGDGTTGSAGGQLGTALTMRDHSEVMALADELSATRSLAEGLRAQVHESANRLHTIVMLVELGDTDAAVELATGDVRAKKALTNRLVGKFDESTLVALLLGKAAEAERRSVELVITDDSRLIGEYPEAVDLVTIVGNLVDNAIDAALAGEDRPRVQVRIRDEDGNLVIQVRDSGPGFTGEAFDHLFEPGWSTKPETPERRHGRGVGMALVQQVVARRGGTVEVGNAGGKARTLGLGGAVVTVGLPLASS